MIAYRTMTMMMMTTMMMTMMMMTTMMAPMTKRERG